MKNWRIELRTGWRTEWEETITQFIASQIKTAREEAGLSQRQLSQITGRSNAFISQVESGRLNATVIDLIGIVFALKKPLSYFLPVEEKGNAGPSGDEIDLLEPYRKLPDEATRRTAIRQVSELAKLTSKPKQK